MNKLERQDYMREKNYFSTGPEIIQRAIIECIEVRDMYIEYKTLFKYKSCCMMVIPIASHHTTE